MLNCHLPISELPFSENGEVCKSCSNADFVFLSIYRYVVAPQRERECEEVVILKMVLTL